MKTRFVADIFLGVALSAVGPVHAGTCESYSVADTRGRFEIARPEKFVDICAQRTPTCLALTAGFPPTVQTVAYFVRESEATRASANRPQLGFTRYYIAQVSQQPAKEFESIRQMLRARHGRIPDSSKPAPGAGKITARSLGVLDEGSHFISIGAVVVSDGGAPAPSVSTASVATNSAAVSGGRLLSLYMYDEYRDEKSIADARARTKTWIECFAGGNSAATK